MKMRRIVLSERVKEQLQKFKKNTKYSSDFFCLFCDFLRLFFYLP